MPLRHDNCTCTVIYKYGVIACHNGNAFRYSVIGELDKSDENLSYIDMLLDKTNRIIYNKDKLGDEFTTKLDSALEQLEQKKHKIGGVLMEITFESICAKLGFNPITNPPRYDLKGYEDDSKESPFAILDLEEIEFLCDYMSKHMN